MFIFFSFFILEIICVKCDFFFLSFLLLSFPPLSFTLSRYSTGDRVGCGVLSDGTVYFTLNGLYLGFPQSGPDAPKIAMGSTVCSIVTATGWDAHLKFHFDPDSFIFCPDEREFEVFFFISRLIKNNFIN